MSESERERPSRPAGRAPEEGEGSGLEAARERVDRLLRTADAAITRVLSEDSERFLQATRQAGGQ